ncbi:MAG: molybdenum cofactor guanylyltransferase [Deltaproteobacteria bacterium]|nr:molybdenum cofactor guanylyltransferase [Deltaproteobacteria bacterium]
MTGAVLAGGKSRRMGFNKALIKIDDRTIIEKNVGLLKKEFDEVFIVANEVLLYEHLSTLIYSDLIKGAGSLGGVFTALFHAKSDYAFVVACDMPFLSPEAIKKMIKSADGSDCIVPFIGGKLHPMHTLYSKKCLKPIKTMIEEGNLRITDLFEKVRVKRLTEEHFKGIPIIESVENVNTQDDLTRIGHK